MIVWGLDYLTFLVIVFFLGYLAIVFEYYLKVNKTAVALFVSVILWGIYFVYGPDALKHDLQELSSHLSDISQIIFFLMSAMTLVEIIDSHKGFKIVTDLIQTTSKRKMLWFVSFASFFLSAVLDNLTTTILMVSLLRKLIPDKEERFLPACMVIIAANSGGAWTPMGDVTTTMLWISDRVTSLAIMKTLFLPSLVSMVVPLLIFNYGMKGKYKKPKIDPASVKEEPHARLIFFLGVGSLISVPAFKAVTGMPPFMAMIMGLAVLWLLTDALHHSSEIREHLRVPHILTKIDTASLLFFLGILLCVSSLQSAGILNTAAMWLDQNVQSTAAIATLIGIFSAIIDNVPLVAATIGMYPLETFPADIPLWHMIAYAAGTGGSILIIGSSSGIALMGMEKVDFVSYFKKFSLPVFVGYLAGMGAYLLIDSFFA